MVYRVSSAHEEGGERVYSVNTKEFVDDGTGSVSAIRFEEVRTEFVDGRPTFVPVEGSTRELPAQLVFLAMGFVGPERAGVIDDLGVELDERGNVRRDAQFQSSVEGVFVAGDVGRGQSLIVWAIAEGRAAAANVDTYLEGSTHLPAPIAPTDVPLR
jgi:glutamate synthase (NADPH/NADH) small chain